MHVRIANQRYAEKTFPAFLAHAQPAILRIWQEAHGVITETEGFVIHIYVTREMGAVIHDTYMWHQAKMR